MHFVEKNIDFDKNKTESKTKSPTHSFGQANLGLKLI